MNDLDYLGGPFATMTEYRSIMDTKENQQEPLMTIPVEVPPPKDAEEGGSKDDDAHDEKCCRICLEDDHPDQMIAPCQCKGGSKWVHRECLDLWRTNEKDRAFSQCTECLYKYHMMIPPQYQTTSTMKWRRAKFCMLVSRDILLVTFLLQVVIGLLGAFVWLCDSDKRSLLAVFCGGSTTTCPNGDWHAVGVYYVCGFLLLLVMMGLYGSITLCFNECSIQNSIPTFIDPEQGGTTHSPTPHQRSATYQNHRQRYHSSSQNRCCENGRCCDGGCCPYGYGYGYGYQPIYYGNTSSNNDCCCCCCGSLGPHHHRHSSSSSNHNADCCRGCDSGGDGECVHILFVILVVTAVIMAVIGFVVGIIIAVIMCQRVIQSHVYLLHKRQLVQEFTVMDLQDYDVLPESETIPAASAPLLYPPPPSAPPMHQEDEIYLQKLGLMEKR